MQANCRSMIQKTEAICDYFENEEVRFGILTETWTNKESEIRIKEQLENENGLDILMKSRKGRGGGVALVYKKSYFQFAKHSFFTGEYEIVAASARVPATKLRLFVFCVYYPPRMLANEVKKMNELICDEIVKIKVKFNSPLIIVAGDMNMKDCDCFSEFNDINLVQTAPTRGDAHLDLCYTNMSVESNSISMPLWSYEGTESDHRVVLYNSVYIGKKLTYTTIIRRIMTKVGEEKFCFLVENFDWSQIYRIETPNEKVEFLHREIERMKDVCFPIKRTRVRSDEDPWITDYIRRLIKRRNSMFRVDARGEKWKKMRDQVREKIQLSKNAYYEREVEKIKSASGNRGLAYTALKNINCSERPKSWNITDLCPDKSEEELVEEIAVYFNSVTKDYQCVRPDLATKTYDRPMYQLTPDMVERRIKTSKKPNSTVPGDLPPKLLSRLASTISAPVADIYNSVALYVDWPSQWKLEYQTIIPKCPSPEGMGQLRNLSCTNFLSKVLELFLIDSISSEISLSDLQYGGIKGCGTDNFLIEMSNNVLETLDSPDTAISLMSVDFSKAFNRLDHQACLEKLAKKNASNQTIALIGAFLEKRMMCVRTANCSSSFRLVKGGSPQGTKLGNLLFCFAIDDITEFRSDPPTEASHEISPERAFPPHYQPSFSSTPVRNEANDSFNPNLLGIRTKKNILNDTTPFEPLNHSQYSNNQTWEIGYIDDLNIGETLKISQGLSHITTSKEKREIRAPGCEEMYQTIQFNGGLIGMQINPAKTQLLCIHANNYLEVRSFISLDERKLQSSDKLKVLGFMFDSRPSPKAHVDFIISKFHRSIWSIFHLKRAGLAESVIVEVYKSMTRPILEYAGNVICSMLTEEDSERLESCQRRCLKIIFGFEMSYAEILNMTNIPSLKSRRRLLFERFCQKMSVSERFSRKWLPKKEQEHSRELRRTKNFIEFNARTDRLYCSPLYEMRRYLNSSS